MKNPVKNPKDNLSLREENEFLRAKIIAEFGGFPSNENPGIPPEIENQFLRNIIALENAEQVKIIEYLETPDFKNEKELTEEQVEIELTRALSLLNENKISLTILGDYPTREIYKFITEELFENEIENVRDTGYWTLFYYEDFHPNEEVDVKLEMEFFLVDLFKDPNEEPANFHEIFGIPQPPEKEGEKLQLAKEFHEKYENFKIMDINFLSINIDNDNAFAEVDTMVDCINKHLGLEEILTSVFKINAQKNNGCWEVVSFSSPYSNNIS